MSIIMFWLLVVKNVLVKVFFTIITVTQFLSSIIEKDKTNITLLVDAAAPLYLLLIKKDLNKTKKPLKGI